MKAVTRYQCEWCKKDWKTPNRHNCKMDPGKRNCFTCSNLNGWKASKNGVDVGLGVIPDPNHPDCSAGVEEAEWDIESIKRVGYDMKCEKWTQGPF